MCVLFVSCYKCPIMLSLLLQFMYNASFLFMHRLLQNDHNAQLSRDCLLAVTYSTEIQRDLIRLAFALMHVLKLVQYLHFPLYCCIIWS